MDDALIALWANLNGLMAALTQLQALSLKLGDFSSFEGQEELFPAYSSFPQGIGGHGKKPSQKHQPLPQSSTSPSEGTKVFIISALWPLLITVKSTYSIIHRFFFKVHDIVMEKWGWTYPTFQGGVCLNFSLSSELISVSAASLHFKNIILSSIKWYFLLSWLELSYLVIHEII